MAKKSDILWWQDGIRRHTKHLADCYERLTVWQDLGDHVRYDRDCNQIAIHNTIIKSYQYELTRAGVKEAV